MHARSFLALFVVAAFLAPAVGSARVVHLTCRDGIAPPLPRCKAGCSRPVRCDADERCDGISTFAIRVCGEVACSDHLVGVPVGQRQKIRLSTTLGAAPTIFVLRSRSHPPTMPCPVPSTSTTLPGQACQTDVDCDDGNGCTHDACLNGMCAHVCLCLTPEGVPACCPGPAALCVRPCGSDASGACGGRCPSRASCETAPGATMCGCVSGPGGPCGGNIFATPPVCAAGLVCQQTNPDATGVCVSTTTTTPCIPFFQFGCSVTSDCCQPCGPGIIPPCAVCLQGHCVGAP
jgi:hypothetical protein